MEKKKLKINMSKLSIGGMEKALVDLLNNSDIVEKYDVTLMLVYNVPKNYLDLVPKDVKIDLVYKGKWNIFGKLITGLRLIKRLIFAKKYYCSICYSHQHGILAKITRKESSNSIAFIHTELKKSRTQKELTRLMKNMKFEKFPKIVCVSNCTKKSFLELIPNYIGHVVVANNYIDYDNILKKSKEKITDVKKEEYITFINVARHDEETKCITRIINSTNKLNKEGYKFRVILVGEGTDTENYKKLTHDLKINNIIFTGLKSNPYPYFKISDAFVFSSCYEGYGIVLNEARVLEIPLITTDVADAKDIIDGYGILCENSENGVYQGMKKFLDEGYQCKKKLDCKKFNDKITKTIDNLIEED